MLLELILTLLWFFALSFGLAWPLAARLRLDPAERLVASAVLSLLALYLFAFAVYVFHLSGDALAVFLPILAAVSLITGRHALVHTFRDADVRALLMGQMLVTAWCACWLLLIMSYSGGGWAGDWYEHWERTQFFLGRWPLDTKFLGFGALPARPPLANLVTGALISPAEVSYVEYQIVTTLLNSLVFLPAALLARRFCGSSGRGRAAIATLAVLLLVNPLFVENSTFAWTKLTAAFFVLAGLYFFLRTQETAPPPAAAPLCGASLAAGLLAHYSAGPYVLVLIASWFIWGRWRDAAFWRRTAVAGGLGALILATWFGWSLAVYGVETTLFSNSSVSVPEAREGNQLLKIALNLRDTTVPHFLRNPDMSLIAQTSPWGRWRDWFFQLYQLNLFFAFGSVAWLVLGRELLRNWSTAATRSRWFWLMLAGGVIVLGVAVHGARDSWGLVHICLQGIVVLGLAYLAARWAALGRGWRIALIAGGAVDLILGIALNFAVQDYAFDRPITIDVLHRYSGSALMNFAGKLKHQLSFISDVVPLPVPLVLALLAGILTLALLRAVRAHRSHA